MKSKTVDVIIKDNTIISVSCSEIHCELPQLERKSLLVWIWEKLEQMGWLIEGDNMRVTFA